MLCLIKLFITQVVAQSGLYWCVLCVFQPNVISWLTVQGHCFFHGFSLLTLF